ncbi:MAG: hypothetical protein IMF17_00785, partial [Proteobacteria bacterium]|nr:hypothetical protein [Pseudomonadota bacterium]
DQSAHLEELSLDLRDDEVANTATPEIKVESSDQVEREEISLVEQEEISPDAKAEDASTSTEDTSASSNKPRENARRYEVSDDALSMLINKTNREVKRNNRVIVLGVLMLSFIVLVVGGVYYYMDMQAEIANLERKHQIAMQSMRLKTSKDIAPEKSEIIRSLVSESDLDEKVQYAKKHMAGEKQAKRVQGKASINNSTGNKVAEINTGELSIERTNKTDPVADKLDRAWQAYESAHYDEANLIYKDVLKIESNNRDALLGLGAIAVIEKDNVKARKIYTALLQQDPRDPIATASLASLRSDDSSLESDEKYLVSMLQKNPNAPHLNFSLGNIYAQQSKWKPAQQAYFVAWQADNENADYIFNLAVSMDQLGKQDQALTFYKDSLLKSNNKQVSFSREAARNRINELTGL